jgi:hypothetical protein
MSDFESSLREQLVTAAERQRARRLPRPGPLAPATLVGGVAAAVLAALVAVAVVGGLRGDPARDPPSPPAPELPGRALFGGSLEAGTRYRTLVFEPTLSFVPRDADWFMRRAANIDLLQLERRNRIPGRPGSERDATQFLSFGRMTEVYDPNVRALHRSRVPPPDDLHRWLSEHPDLRVGAAEPVVVAGAPGEQFGFEVSFTRPAHSDPRCRDRLMVCTRLGPPIGSFTDGSRVRMTVLDTEPDQLAITLSGRSADDLAEVEAAAQPLLESLRIAGR